MSEVGATSGKRGDRVQMTLAGYVRQSLVGALASLRLHIAIGRDLGRDIRSNAKKP